LGILQVRGGTEGSGGGTSSIVSCLRAGVDWLRILTMRTGGPSERPLFNLSRKDGDKRSVGKGPYVSGSVVLLCQKVYSQSLLIPPFAALVLSIWEGGFLPLNESKKVFVPLLPNIASPEEDVFEDFPITASCLWCAPDSTVVVLCSWFPLYLGAPMGYRMSCGSAYRLLLLWE
jgi:hypothetical protein